MAFYECVYLARPEITAAQVENLTTSFSEVLEQGGGIVVSREYWGLRNLAYRMNKSQKAHYVLLNIDAPSSAMQEMERIMSLSEDVMRRLVLRVEALSEEPSIMMKKSHSEE